MNTVSHRVAELSVPDKAALEHLVGRPLGQDDHVVVVAFQAGDRDEALREAARARVRATIEDVARRTAAAGVHSAEADEAVAEAMRAIRPRAKP